MPVPEKKHKYFDKHQCILKEPPNPGLERLPPNASCGRRLLYKIREQLILDIRSSRSRYFFRSNAHRKSELRRCKMEQKWFIIHPFSRGKLIFDLLLFMVWTVILIFQPLFYMLDLKWILSLKMYVAPLFILYFFTGYVKKNEVVIDWKKIMLHYVTSFFIIDLVIFTLIPVVLLITETSIESYRDTWYKYWYLALIDISFGFIRFFSILFNIERVLDELDIGRVLSFFLFHSYSLIYYLNLCTCLIYLIPWAVFVNNFPEASWIYKSKIYLKGFNQYEKYCECCLMAICTFFGATYNKFKVWIPMEQIPLALTAMVGRLYTLWFLAKVLKLFGIVTVSETKYQQGIMAINDYIVAKKLPHELRDRLLAFYEFKFQRKYFKEEELISQLSDFLKSEIFLYGARYLIEKTYVLKKLDKYILGGLFAHMKSETYLAGDVIAKCGDLIDTVYFVCSGTVVVYSKDGHELNHLKDGSDLGFLKNWIVKPYKYTYTYIAIETTEIYYIPVKTFVNFIKEKYDILDYFESKTIRNLSYYKDLELQAGVAKQDTMIDDVRMGKVLETRTPKHYVYE